MALLDTAIVFVVSLLIGALGIYVGARLIVDRDDYSYALITALIGAVVWAIVGFFFGWIPFLGPVLVFLAYLTVLNVRYPGGWLDAALIALIAWLASLIVLYVLGFLGLIPFEALGVPGV